MSKVTLKHVYKVYDGGVRAVNDFNLEIKDQEFIVFVGPSGCGKSTTLRMIAGLENITAGHLYIDNALVNDVDSKDRDIAMVFQNYALYPHMTVYQNMAFGLKLRKENPKDIDDRVRKATEILEISDLLTRRPKALSGGQRQRVALGRAIVREPKVFLLDEPLSNLDAKLRVQMRIEITKLHKRLATTFIYVTHDQTEAMTMGDRIVVMKDGYIQQVDTPVNLYENPTNLFVATFLGSPQMNIFDCTLESGEGTYIVKASENGPSLILPPLKGKQLNDAGYVGKELLFGIRPEHIHFADKGVPAIIDVVEQLGDETIAYVKVEGIETNIIVKGLSNGHLKAKQQVYLAFELDKCHLFDKKSTNSVLGIPRENRFSVQIDNNQLAFGNNHYVFSEQFKSRLLESCHENIPTFLCFAPEKVSLDPIEGGMKLDAKVDFVDVKTDSVVVFALLKGCDHHLVFKVDSESTIKSGDKISTYVKEEDIIIRDSDGVRLNSREALIPNICDASIENVDGKSIVSFAGNKVVLPFFENKGGRQRIRIHQDKVKVVFTKKVANELHIAKQEYDKSRLVAVSAYDEDGLGAKNAIFVQIAGFDHYSTFVVDNNFSVYKMPKFNLYLEDGAISIAE